MKCTNLLKFLIYSILTVHLSRADLAAPAGQQHGVVARRRRALRLDVLAPHTPHDPPLLVNLREKRGRRRHFNIFTNRYRKVEVKLVESFPQPS